MALVGSYVGLSKQLVLIFPVFLLAWLRFGIGGLAMLSWLRKPASEAPLDAPTKRLLFLESFLGNFLFSICMLFGVSMTSAVAAGVIMASIPACVAVMSWLFLRERVGSRVWAAVACAVLGISLVSLSKSEHLAQEVQGLSDDLAYKNAWLGNLLVFCAVLCEAAYAVIGKKLTGVMTPKRISSLINLWGFLLVMPLGIWQALRFDFSGVSVSMWLLLLFYSLAASVWTVWLWMTGLKTVPAAKAGVFTVMLPIAAAAVGVLLLGERMNGLQMIAFAIALVGVVLATLPEKSSSV
ncbi:DMT family transporter [Variovorax sp. PCZ-1]|nr:DMT family transporter [Variovorax sp. PCZ-1]MBS7806887.1 DMT family transporter [Variovorax sp. PCZ-1]